MNSSIQTNDPYTALGKSNGGSANPKHKAHKQLIAAHTVNFLLAIVIVILIISNFYFAILRQPRDYVLEVDNQNRVTYGGALDAEISNWVEYMPNEIIRFIENWRMVTGDNTMQKIAANRLYCMLIPNTAASTRMDNYYKEPSNNPFEVNKEKTRTISMRNILQQSENTWHVEFSETTRNHKGEVMGTERFKSQMVISRGELRGSCAESNPLGVYITDINWSSVL